MDGAGNRERIERSALEAFCAKGFKGTSVRAIAQRSCVSVGNVYNHAPSKEALFDRLFADHFPGSHLERMFEGVQPGSGLDGAMAAVLGNMLRFAEEDPAFFRLAMVDLNEFGGEHLRRYGAPYDRPIGETLSAIPGGEGLAAALGALRPDVRGDEFTRFFLWLFFAVGFTADMRKKMAPEEKDDGTFATVRKVLQRGVAAMPGDRAAEAAPAGRAPAGAEPDGKRPAKGRGRR
jgi:AcrR family transcriptional regulator